MADRRDVGDDPSEWPGYWPPERDNPILRLIVALALGPGLLAAALTVAWAALASAFTDAPAPFGRGMSELFHDSVEVFYRAALMWFAPAMVLLYAFRLRAWSTFLLFAVASAALDVGLGVLAGQPSRASRFVSTVILFAPLFLTLRAMAGIRAPAPDR